METWEKISALQVMKQRHFRLLLCIEVLLLAVGIAGLFGKNAVYEYGPERMAVNFGTRTEGSGAVYVDSQSGLSGNAVDFPEITLSRGVYRVELQYATDVDYQHSCTVTDNTGESKDIRTNGALLFSGLDHTSFDMWLTRDSDRLIVHAGYSGVGSLTVRGLTIRQTNAMNRMALFWMLCAFTSVNIGYLYRQYDKAYAIPAKNKTVTFLLGLTIALVSIPIMTDYLIVQSYDLVYHLMRVEGIADGLRSGQFPVRISPEWLQGYGYACPIFYGETALYLAGLLRLIGFSVTDACRIFLFIVNAATVLLSYRCFKKMFAEPYVGVFCSMLYSLSVYRIYNTWFSSAWGECLGILFLPLLVYGFWRVFTQDVGEESYKRSWLPLTIGFSMLIQSHLLSGEKAGFFTIILCLILWRKVLRPRTFLVLAKTVVYSILLSAWFLVPFADYMTTGNFVIQHVSGRTIQYRGLYPAHLLLTYFINGDSVFFDEGMYDSCPMGIGIAPVAALGALAYLFFSGRTERCRREDRGLGKIAGCFSVLAMLMSLNLFPWDRIQSLNNITATLVSSIEFPNRFLAVANVCLTACAGVVAKYVLDQKKRLSAVLYFGGMAFLLCISCLYLTDHTMNSASPGRIYNSEGMGTGYISGNEYLPYGADPRRFVYHDPICTEGLICSDYQKKPLGAEAVLTNQTVSDGAAAFALLYYKGYHAYADGRELECCAGDNFEVTVKVPPGFDGKIEVGFVSPWHWRAGELVSLLTLLAIAAFFWVTEGRKRNVLRQANID